MTGYGRATKQTAIGTITVEIRSTNHRYLEIDQRLPNGFSGFQERLAGLVRQRARRGRIELFVAIQLERNHRKVTFDEELLRRYHDALVDLKAQFALKGPLTLDHFLSLPQALTVIEDRIPSEQLWEPIRSSVEAAIQELVRARGREGAKLVKDIRNQVQVIQRHAKAVKQRLPKALAQQRERLREQLQGLIGPGAVGSVAQLRQAVALVEDVNIHEEVIRLESHITYVQETLAQHQLVGKRLDFIAQELMREVNTMGAKVNDAIAAQRIVEIKGCIEKIREQVQNLE